MEQPIILSEGDLLKIATWNVERLKHHRDADSMLREIEKIDADILVLTETDSRLLPDYPYYYNTPLLREIRPDYYRETENRVSVFSKYRCVRQHETYDKYTAICVELDTGAGNLFVYGTIMGIFGNRESSFKGDLLKQMEDIRRLSAHGNKLCVIGDYNLSFCDNYYYTRYGRDLVNQTFEDCRIDILTRDMTWCIDHIAVTKSFASRIESIEEWNLEKTLSDHKGIAVSIV